MFYYIDYQSCCIAESGLTEETKTTTRYTFRIESTGKGGYANLRMCAIERLSENYHNLDEYDPEVHQNAHYMANTWKARIKRKNEEGKKIITYVTNGVKDCMFYKTELIPSEKFPGLA